MLEGRFIFLWDLLALLNAVKKRRRLKIIKPRKAKINILNNPAIISLNLDDLDIQVK